MIYIFPLQQKELMMTQAATAENNPKITAAKASTATSTQAPPKLPPKKTAVKKIIQAQLAAVQASPKEKKDKLIRDSFTIPESEYVVLSSVKKACLNASIEVKKSELIRIAIGQLGQMSIPKLTSALKGLTKIQSGRPKK
jgi:hypothetical protein